MTGYNNDEYDDGRKCTESGARDTSVRRHRRRRQLRGLGGRAKILNERFTMAKYILILPKLRNFAKSGHTEFMSAAFA